MAEESDDNDDGDDGGCDGDGGGCDSDDGNNDGFDGDDGGDGFNGHTEGIVYILERSEVLKEQAHHSYIDQVRAICNKQEYNSHFYRG